MPSNAARIAREIFLATLAEIEVGRVVRGRVRHRGDHVEVDGQIVTLEGVRRVVVIAIGKASVPFASAVHEAFESSEHDIDGIVVSPQRAAVVPPGFRAICGGHPLPDRGSLEAGRAVLEIVRDANQSDVLVVFAISGGASALCECPITLDLTLDDLRATNRILVGCGATIAEINALRRRLSSIKGGQLAAAAPRARQLSLLVSDVNPGDLESIGSGPTVRPAAGGVDIRELLDRHELQRRLPPSVIDALAHERPLGAWPEHATYAVLLDSSFAIDTARRCAGERFELDVEVLDGLDEAPVEDVARALVARAEQATRPTCYLSAGEAVCPVRGPGRGGRNLETALRAARVLATVDSHHDLAVLSAGTDGVDGTSPVAGAWADCTTVTRAAVSGMRPDRYLARSDSYEFFAALGDTLLTGPTGNNVRDLRVAVCIPAGSGVWRRR